MRRRRRRQLLVAHGFFFVVSVSLCSFPENQQASASLQGQTQQVQRVRAAGCLPPHLCHLVLVRRGDGEAPGAARDLGSQGGFVGSGAQNPTGSRFPSQPLGQSRLVSVSLVFSCGGSFYPLSEGSFGDHFPDLYKAQVDGL